MVCEFFFAIFSQEASNLRIFRVNQSSKELNLEIVSVFVLMKLAMNPLQSFKAAITRRVAYY